MDEEDFEGLGFYLLTVRLPDAGEIHEIPFDDLSDIELWLDNTWPAYESWLCGDSGEVVQDDSLTIDYIGGDGLRSRDSIVYTDSDSGQLVIG